MTDFEAHDLRCEWLTYRYMAGYEPDSKQRSLLMRCERICFDAGLIVTNWEPAGGEKEEHE